jgi:hypothetical protein
VSAERDPVFGCELVTSRLDKDGYAYHGLSRAHIVAWEAAHGARPLDEGKPKPIDHLCRRRNCRALHHLELVTKRENELRKSWRYRAAIKRCPRGHSMEHALVTPEMGRLCRTCANEVARSVASAECAMPVGARNDPGFKRRITSETNNLRGCSPLEGDPKAVASRPYLAEAPETTKRRR